MLYFDEDERIKDDFINNIDERIEEIENSNGNNLIDKTEILKYIKENFYLTENEYTNKLYADISLENLLDFIEWR